MVEESRWSAGPIAIHGSFLSRKFGRGDCCGDQALVSAIQSESIEDKKRILREYSEDNSTAAKGTKIRNKSL